REDNDLTEVQMDLCQRIMAGESVARICRDEHMPAQSTVYQWLVSNDQFRAAYQLAKQLMAETLADEVLDISDDSAGDYVEGENGKSFNPEHVQRAKLRVDSRKWLASKLAPKRYGDATTLNHESGMTLNVVTGVPQRSENLSAEQVAVRIASIMAAAEKRRK
ncbi:MAG: hypothetical protein ACKO1N_04275, partial [Erythrobacter sp.]